MHCATHHHDGKIRVRGDTVLMKKLFVHEKYASKVIEKIDSKRNMIEHRKENVVNTGK